MCVSVSGGGEAGVFEYYSPHKNLNTKDRLHFGDTGEQIIHLLQIGELSQTIERLHSAIYTCNLYHFRLFVLRL